MSKKYIITSGCSFTRQYKRIGFNGTDVDFLDDDTKFWRWPHHIKDQYKNFDVYNLGNPTNDNGVIAQSIIKKINDLLTTGISPKDIKVIIQWTDQTRNSFFISDSIAKLYNVEPLEKNSDDDNPMNPENIDKWSHLNGFSNKKFGYYLLTGNGLINHINYPKDIIDIHFKYTSPQESAIRFFTNIILIQNFCKVNRIKNLFMFNLSYNFNTNTYPKSYKDIKKVYLEKEIPEFYNEFKTENSYISYLYNNIDFKNFWFYENKYTNCGGQLEWAISEFDFKNDKRLFMEHSYIEDDLIKFCKKNKSINPIGHVSSEMNKKFVDTILTNFLKK